MRDLGTQILICRGSVLDHNNLSSHKARGCLRFLQRLFQRLGDGPLVGGATCLTQPTDHTKGKEDTHAACSAWCSEDSGETEHVTVSDADP